MTRALTYVCTVRFMSTKPGAVSSAKRGCEEEPGKVFPRERLVSQTLRGDSLVTKAGGVQAERRAHTEA